MQCSYACDDCVSDRSCLLVVALGGCDVAINIYSAIVGVIAIVFVVAVASATVIDRVCDSDRVVCVVVVVVVVVACIVFVRAHAIACVIDRVCVRALVGC